jgi:hypothetical protein
MGIHEEGKEAVLAFYNDSILMFPNNLRPMPLKRHREAFSHPDWLFELQHDGFRALSFVRIANKR